MIPKPHYTLINTSRGSDPAVVVVNSALRAFEGREIFPWHLKLTMDCKMVGANGMPTAQETAALEQLEDEIAKSILTTENAVFLARITCRGQRELVYRAQDPEAANDALQRLAASPSPVREWDYRMEHDPEWTLAEPELKLLERDPRIN